MLFSRTLTNIRNQGILYALSFTIAVIRLVFFSIDVLFLEGFNQGYTQHPFGCRVKSLNPLLVLMMSYIFWLSTVGVLLKAGGVCLNTPFAQ